VPGDVRFLLDEPEKVDLVGFEWEEAESRAAEMGVAVVRVALGESGPDTPCRVIRQVERDGRLELVTAPEVWG